MTQEQYDLRIRHLDVATRCARCRFLRLLNKWDFPNFLTYGVWTCGRYDGCIFSDYKEKLQKFHGDEFGYQRGINGFKSAFVKDGKVYIV